MPRCLDTRRSDGYPRRVKHTSPLSNCTKSVCPRLLADKNLMSCDVVRCVSTRIGLLDHTSISTFLTYTLWVFHVYFFQFYLCDNSSICGTRLFNVVTLTTWCYQYIARLRQFSRWLFTFDFWLQQVEWILKRFGDIGSRCFQATVMSSLIV